MNHTKIEWVKNPDGSQGYVWNPIKGLCPMDCKTPDGKSYCYARKIYKRFRWMDHEICLHNEHLFGIPGYSPIGKKLVSSKIFICSTFELFHPIADQWRERIFKIINYHPEYIFITLTKLPQNIDRPIPDNVWLGTTITCQDEMWRYWKLRKINAKKLFISFEPMLSPIKTIPPSVDWVIIGRLTGYGQKYNPKLEWIEKIIQLSRWWNPPIPIFLKNNLKEIWRKKLIQEMPE